ncbi:hypothetical protein ACFL6W_08610, partial [Thermodesulfobacteriota bacterium]
MLKEKNRNLLRELMLQVLSNPAGVDALKFRADHEYYLEDIDELENSVYINKENNKYEINLLTLSEFKDEDQWVGRMLDTCARVFLKLRKLYKESPGENFRLDQVLYKLDIPSKKVRRALVFLTQAPIWSSYTKDLINTSQVFISPDENILKYKTLDDVITQLRQWASDSYPHSKKTLFVLKEKEKMKNPAPEKPSIKPKSKDVWSDIANDYDISKRMFGKKINFVDDRFKRQILFRDVEHAYILANLGFSKPAVILAGGVIEELLSLYLQHKNIKPNRNTFNAYIQACETHGLLKRAIQRLTDSLRHFRNLVHLSNEKTKRETISKAAA